MLYAKAMTKWATSTKHKLLTKPISDVDVVVDEETTFSADEALFIVERSALQMSIAFHDPSIISQ